VKFLVTLTLLIFSIVPGVQAFGQERPSPKTRQASADDPPCPEERSKTAEVHYRDYILRTFRLPLLEGCMQVSKKGRIVYSRDGWSFLLGKDFLGRPSVSPGIDITGLGKPNAIVGEWSGGVHCCFTFRVFELGEEFKEIGAINAEHSDGAHFVRSQSDGSYYFEGNDWAFAYWGASFMDSPAPKIILKYRDRRFRLAYDLMRKPAPTSEEFAKLVAEVTSDENWNPKSGADCLEGCGAPVSLWKNMLELMYTGHVDLAWKLLDQSWPSRQLGKSVFIRQFCKQLRSSRYWPDLRSSVGQCPPRL
jgi:hypothetical protein